MNIKSLLKREWLSNSEGVDLSLGLILKIELNISKISSFLVIY